MRRLVVLEIEHSAATRSFWLEHVVLFKYIIPLFALAPAPPGMQLSDPVTSETK